MIRMKKDIHIALGGVKVVHLRAGDVVAEPHQDLLSLPSEYYEDITDLELAREREARSVASKQEELNILRIRVKELERELGLDKQEEEVVEDDSHVQVIKKGRR